MNPYPLLRNLLFRLDPETAHDLTLRAMRPGIPSPICRLLGAGAFDRPVEVMGLTFPNRVGLAAGLDKNAECLNALTALGFGCVEVGTVTPRPQPGNPAPRLFRIPEQQAIINRMGFNNKGVDYVVERVRRFRRKHRRPAVIGINIGKNKTTPNEQAVDDYRICLRKAYGHADYIAVNISSPNTPGLRDLQRGDELKQLLDALQNERRRLAVEYRHVVPLALKIAPDMNAVELDAVADAALAYGLDALIIGNTTLSRPSPENGGDHPLMRETGGLSGRPLMGPSTEALKAMHQRVGARIPLIGVGGIHSGEDAAAKYNAGAALVQIYTGFIYRGPRLIREVIKQEKGERKKDKGMV